MTGAVIERVGCYEIVGTLARGGMAEVLRARWSRLGAERTVVVKRILPQFAGDAAFVRMFREEVRLSALVDHPNVVKILDAGDDDGRPYLVMEYVEGATLKSIIETDGALRPGAAVAVAIAVAKALQAAHSLVPVVVHRDVSPHNVLIDRRGFVKLADFGIAGALDGVATRQHQPTFLGKLAYASPERLAGEPGSTADDQYALGLTLYEALTGVRAYAEESEATLARSVAGGEWASQTAAWLAVPAEIRSVVERTLARDPAERYPGIRALQDDLQARMRCFAADDWEQSLSRRASAAAAQSRVHPTGAGGIGPADTTDTTIAFELIHDRAAGEGG